MGAGTLFGSAYVVELPWFVTLAALLVFFRQISMWGLRYSLRAGLAFGFVSTAIAAHWIPAALVNLDMIPLASWGCFLALCFGIGGIPWAGWGAIAWAVRDAPIWGRGACMFAAVYGWEWLISHQRLGIPGMLVAHPFTSDLGLSQLAAVIGTVGVSSTMVAVPYCLSSATRSSKEPARVVVSLLAGLTAVSALGMHVATAARNGAAELHSRREILLVQPGVSRNDRWAADLQLRNLRRLGTYTALAIDRAGRRPALVVWPETAFTTPLDLDDRLRKELVATAQALGASIASGVVLSADRSLVGSYRGASVWIDPDVGIVDIETKKMGVPLVEAGLPPVLRWLGGWLFGSTTPNRRMVVAQGDGLLQGDFSIRVLHCYEALFPITAASPSRGPISAILVLADDSWTSSDVATRQLTRFAALRAIEQRLPVARIAHQGTAAFFDEYGRLVSQVQGDSISHLWGTLTPSSSPSGTEKIALISLLSLTTAACCLFWPGAQRFSRARWR